jgi:hypothetical protein
VAESVASAKSAPSCLSYDRRCRRCVHRPLSCRPVRVVRAAVLHVAGPCVQRTAAALNSAEKNLGATRFTAAGMLWLLGLCKVDSHCTIHATCAGTAFTCDSCERTVFSCDSREREAVMEGFSMLLMRLGQQAASFSVVQMSHVKAVRLVLGGGGLWRSRCAVRFACVCCRAS